MYLRKYAAYLGCCWFHTVFKEFIYGISKAEFFVHYLFFGTSKIFIGQIHYDHLLVPGQV